MRGMSDLGWNSVTVSEEEQPRVSMEDLREMMADLDPDDFDEPVQRFLDELAGAEDCEELKQAATMLLQDEIDFSPDMAALGIEPDEGLIALLLAVGADVNARNAYGQPPLHLAAKYGYKRIVEMLLASGARKTLHNSQGKLAVDETQDAELAELLMPPMDDEMPLPPEIEDADYVPAEEHECRCGEHEHGHGCSCGHHDCKH